MNLKNIWRRLRGQRKIKRVEYWMGVDWGRGGDLTAFTTLHRDHVNGRCLVMPQPTLTDEQNRAIHEYFMWRMNRTTMFYEDMFPAPSADKPADDYPNDVLG